MKDIKLICHSSIKITCDDGKIIYFDPFKLNEKCYKDADIIFITHPHYDHFSPEDIRKIKKEETYIVIVKELLEQTIELGFSKEKIIMVEPNEEYQAETIVFKTVPAYNVNKKFHQKEFEWVRIYSRN